MAKLTAQGHVEVVRLRTADGEVKWAVTKTAKGAVRLLRRMVGLEGWKVYASTKISRCTNDQAEWWATNLLLQRGYSPQRDR